MDISDNERFYALKKALKLDFGGQPFLISISAENVRIVFEQLEAKYPDVTTTLDHYYNLTGKWELVTSSALLARRLGLTRQAVSDRLRRGHVLMRNRIEDQWHVVLRRLVKAEFGSSPQLSTEVDRLTIDDLKLRVRTRNCLVNYGLNSVPAILKKDAAWFLDRKRKGFGQKTLEDLTRALRRHGLHLQ